MDGAQDHWDDVWRAKSADEVSWYHPSAEPCTSCVRGLTSADDHIAIIGAGVSALVIELVGTGYRNLEAIDIAQPALEQLGRALGDAASAVTLRQCDVREITFDEPVDLWHDRATFHFLVDPADQRSYVKRAIDAVRPGGHLVIATFGAHGPDRCSGLPVQRYDATALAETFGPTFELVDAFERDHHTPTGATQRFQHAVLVRR